MEVWGEVSPIWESWTKRATGIGAAARCPELAHPEFCKRSFVQLESGKSRHLAWCQPACQILLDGICRVINEFFFLNIYQNKSTKPFLDRTREVGALWAGGSWGTLVIAELWTRAKSPHCRTDAMEAAVGWRREWESAGFGKSYGQRIWEMGWGWG